MWLGRSFSVRTDEVHVLDRRRERQQIAGQELEVGRTVCPIAADPVYRFVQVLPQPTTNIKLAFSRPAVTQTQCHRARDVTCLACSVKAMQGTDCSRLTNR